MQHLSESELAGYLDQDLSPAERLRVEEHLDVCFECREEAIETARLLGGDWERMEAPAKGSGSGSRWRRPAVLVGLASAAAVAALLLVDPGEMPTRMGTPASERFDSEGVEEIRVHTPQDDARVRREELLFAWGDRNTSSYRISITAEDGGLIWTAPVVDTVIAPPTSLNLVPGARYFWFVDAIDAGVTGRTAAHSFVVVP